MKNEKILKEWMEFAEMDFLTAKHLYEHMYPKPLEIICYHCQQAIEKLLKGVLISKDVTIKKTHDLGLLAEMLQEYTEVDEKYLEMCDDLTPYGVKIRYPQEMENCITLRACYCDGRRFEGKKTCLWRNRILLSMLCSGLIV